MRAESPEYAAINSHVLQDVLVRLDKTHQAFFRRLKHGEIAGFPPLIGRNAYHSFTFKQYGNGARSDNGYLVLAKIGRVRVHWSRPMEGTPKTVTLSKAADGWYVAISCAEVPVHPLPLTGQETAIDVGIESCVTTADGVRTFSLRHITVRANTISGYVSGAWRDARREVAAGARPLPSLLMPTSTSRGSGATSTTRWHANSCSGMT